MAETFDDSKHDPLATSKNPSPKHRNNKNHESIKIAKHKENMQTCKHYALESQITKNDLKSHNFELYPIAKYLEPCSHLNWFKIKLINLINLVYP